MYFIKLSKAVGRYLSLKTPNIIIFRLQEFFTMGEQNASFHTHQLISVISLRKILWRCMGNRASTPISSFSLDDAEQTRLQIIHPKSLKPVETGFVP